MGMRLESLQCGSFAFCHHNPPPTPSHPSSFIFSRLLFENHFIFIFFFALHSIRSYYIFHYYILLFESVFFVIVVVVFLWEYQRWIIFSVFTITAEAMLSFCTKNFRKNSVLTTFHKSQYKHIQMASAHRVHYLSVFTIGDLCTELDSFNNNNMQSAKWEE